MRRYNEKDFNFVEYLYKLPNRVEVCKIIHKDTKVNFCMKKLYADSIQHASNLQRECFAMVFLDHPHIMKMHSVILGGEDNQISHISIIMDYYEEGDLQKMIYERMRLRNYFTENDLIEYLKQLVSAYAYMQIMNIAHRDIKPQNIFVCENGTILKVGDLGSAVIKTVRSGSTIVGTPLYLSPKLREAHNRNQIITAHNAFKSDVYSLGMTFLYMATLEKIDSLSIDLETRIESYLNSLTNSYPNIKNFLAWMLTVEEANRPDFLELEKCLFPNNDIRQNCIACLQSKSFNDLLSLDDEKICRNCFTEVYSRLIPQWEYNHCVSDGILHEIRNFKCECMKKFCKYCKDEKHRGVSCAHYSNAAKKMGISIKGVLRCPCDLDIMERTKSIFLVCPNFLHSICRVCGGDWNSSLHKTCLMIFSAKKIRRK